MRAHGLSQGEVDSLARRRSLLDHAVRSHLPIGYHCRPFTAGLTVWGMGCPSPIGTIQTSVSCESGPSDGLKYLGMFHVKPKDAAAGPDRDDLGRNRD